MSNDLNVRTLSFIIYVITYYNPLALIITFKICIILFINVTFSTYISKQNLPCMYSFNFVTDI